MKPRTFALALVLLIGLVGCSSDDDCPTCLPEIGRGTITISIEPSGINAPWVLSGPAGLNQSGSGEATIENTAAGSYTLTWEEVGGWVAPSAQTENLAAGGTASFSGVFVEQGFVYIPPGTFVMGSPADEPWRLEREGPQHQVTLTKGFYMSRYELTEQCWAEVMNETPTTSQLPKDRVSWDMAVQFCNALSVREGLTPAYTIHGTNGNVTWHQDANGYRLPTEAEWEYACRAGSTTAFANGPITGRACSLPLDPNLIAMGWYCGNASTRQPVGMKQANARGLYDMHGNLSEWVWCGAYRQYTSSPQEDPVVNVGPGTHRVLRGGCWSYPAEHCRSAFRFLSVPAEALYLWGFRPVRSAF